MTQDGDSDTEADKPATRLARGGRRAEWTGRGVSPPVWRASTILFDSVADLQASRPTDRAYHYGRSGTPTQWALAEALTQLEPGAAVTRLFPSGLAAVAAAILSCVGAGDELLMVDSVYGPTRTLCDGLLKRMGVTTRYYDPLAGAAISGQISEQTRALFLESPGSLSFEVQDVPALCQAARERGVATIIDNTWATPLLFPALSHGCDLSVLACTKYVAGHSDVLLGSVTANAARAAQLEQTARALGQTAGGDDCFLALRGLRTLDIRLRRHGESALRIARWLADQPQVAHVLHPALPSCPGHEHWRRDFAGASGLFAFVLNRGDNAARNCLIERLRLFGIGYSWGGFESLAVPADTAGLRSVRRPPAAGPAVRLSIGLEDPEDLLADLAQALSAYPN